MLGPDYASMDLMAGRKIDLGGRYHRESFNLFNRDNTTYGLADSGFYNAASQFVKYSQKAGTAYYPAYYQQPTSFMKPTSSFALRQMRFSMRLNF